MPSLPQTKSPVMLSLSRKGRFQTSEELTPSADSYSLLPFRFERMEDDPHKAVLVSESGEYASIDYDDLEQFVNHALPTSSLTYRTLRKNGFLVDNESTSNARFAALKIRTRYRHLPEFTSLHMFVVTLRCNQSCPYCQVSRQSEDRAAFDMTEDKAAKALAHVFKSPSPYIKIEFQGGESLLNFELIKFIVRQAKEYNRSLQKPKVLEFVAATNMTFLTDEIVEFFGREEIYFSTSIDGPEDLHNSNRPYKGANAFTIVCDNIRRVQNALGSDRISALMTTTGRSLGRESEIIDQYVSLGFDGIFLRPLSPYGFAVKTKTYYDYSAEEWVDFYTRGLDYVLKLNREGAKFTEYYTTIILRKMLKHDSTGYVNLQSPAGAGIMAAIYDYNGRVYASDEGRMMAQMHDEKFYLGDVEQPYEELFLGSSLLTLLDDSLAQSAPQCSDCAFLPWCGSDPEYHWATQRDITGHKAFSGFCRKNMSIFHQLICRLERDDADSKILRSWV